MQYFYDHIVIFKLYLLKKENSSYNQILKSTTIFGGSQVFIILIGLIRTKIIAVLLGPLGVGFIGICYSLIDMMRSGYGLGIDTAGVREIAEVHAQNDDKRLGKTIYIFLWWFRRTAILGAISCLIFCYPISVWAFGDGSYAFHVACLSVCVWLSLLTLGRSTILQGLRKVGELAKSNILAGFIGLIITVPLYYFWGLESIVTAFILTHIASFLCIQYYYDRISVKPIRTSREEALKGGFNSLHLGLYIVAGAAVSAVCMFAIRAYISRAIDVDAAGLFHAAWTITNIYLGLILRSMGTDFFPRLSAIISDRRKVRKLINEQSYVVLVIASPIVIGMLLFTDLIFEIFYSPDFLPAGTILRWQIAGTFLKVLSWPIAFIMLAKGKGRVYLFSEIVFFMVYLGCGYLLFPEYGIDGFGIGFFLAYLVYLPMAYIIGWKISRFSWDRDIIVMVITNIILICLAFYTIQFYSGYIMYVIGGILFVITTIYAFYKLRKVFSKDDLRGWFRKK